MSDPLDEVDTNQEPDFITGATSEQISGVKSAYDYMTDAELAKMRVEWARILVNPAMNAEQVARAKVMVHTIAAEQHKRLLYGE